MCFFLFCLCHIFLFWILFCWFLCVLKLIIVKMMMIGVFVSGLVRTMSLVGQWAGNSPDRSHTYKDDVDTDLFSPWWEHTRMMAMLMMKILKMQLCCYDTPIALQCQGTTNSTLDSDEKLTWSLVWKAMMAMLVFMAMMTMRAMMVTMSKKTTSSLVWKAGQKLSSRLL